MEVWQFILLTICQIPIEYLCVRWAVKSNPVLFYELHEQEIIRELKKLDNKKTKI